jgi:hypothetical protein
MRQYLELHIFSKKLFHAKLKYEYANLVVKIRDENFFLHLLTSFALIPSIGISKIKEKFLDF